MNLTEQQIKSIYLLYGEAKDDADYIIDILKHRKGNVQLFDKNGYINYTIEEFEKKLNNPLSDKEYKKDSVYITEITEHFTQIKQLVRKLNHRSSLDFVFRDIAMLENSLARRTKRLNEREVINIDYEIEYLKSKLQSLENEDTELDFM